MGRGERGEEDKERRREEGEGKERDRKRGTPPHTVAQAATFATYQRAVGTLHDNPRATLSIASTLTAALN